MTTDDYREVVDEPRNPDPFILAAHVSAQQYTGPRMHLGTATDREIAAHVDGWAAARDHLAAQETDGERAVRELHTPREEQVITGDCSTEECDHEDGCPTVPLKVCTECARIAEEGSPYYAENGIEFVAYPCRTIRTLSAARAAGRDAR